MADNQNPKGSRENPIIREPSSQAGIQSIKGGLGGQPKPDKK